MVVTRVIVCHLDNDAKDMRMLGDEGGESQKKPVEFCSAVDKRIIEREEYGGHEGREEQMQLEVGKEKT